MVLDERSPYNLISISGPFSVILHPLWFHKFEFIDTSSAGEKATQITKILRCYKFSKMGTLFWLKQHINLAALTCAPFTKMPTVAAV